MKRRGAGTLSRADIGTKVLLQAWGVLAARVKPGAAMTSPQAVKDYLRLQIGLLEYEVF